MAQLRIDLDAASEGPHWLSRRVDTTREQARAFVRRKRLRKSRRLVLTPFGDLVKFDENQPRVPAGHGEESGRWTSGGAGSRADAFRGLSPEQRAEVSRRADEIRAHPEATAAERDAAEMLARADLLAEQALAGGDTRTQYKTATGWAPEREALHKRLIEKVVSKPGTIAGEGEQPTVIFMGGLPASGKSTTVEGLDRTGYVVINADDFKEELPEYTGENAAVLHEESSELAERALQVAKANRQHIIYDATLKTPGRPDDGGALGKIEDFKRAGYRVEVRFVDMAVDEAVRRSVARYVRKELKDGKGRYVPAKYIRGARDAQWGSKPRATFEAVKGRVDAYVLIDNNGATPREVERQGDLRKARCACCASRRLCRKAVRDRATSGMPAVLARSAAVRRAGPMSGSPPPARGMCPERCSRACGPSSSSCGRFRP
jgi:hypothetical protein